MIETAIALDHGSTSSKIHTRQACRGYAVSPPLDHALYTPDRPNLYFLTVYAVCTTSGPGISKFVIYWFDEMKEQNTDGDNLTMSPVGNYVVVRRALYAVAGGPIRIVAQNIGGGVTPGQFSIHAYLSEISRGLFP